ncbi:Hpt domain-containing protein [Clostridium transplantifaecale]|uniref:Hpt domain-containing protein n=1 Tax=Clostridium transplantifaecale TaxID=2479838 RepID=UPI000F63E325|nr:Hpt domain-containing protein [Clostridium transplantifaecale]
MDIKEVYTKLGEETEFVIARFGGNISLLERFVKKFVEDPTYGRLMKSLKDKDYHEIEIGAHTLKGVAANLGFNKLSETAASVVQAVREKKTDRIPELSEAMSAEYKNVIECIAGLDTSR